MISVDKTNCVVNSPVKRGKDWSNGNQDYHDGKPGMGKIAQCAGTVAKVKWEGGVVAWYHTGASGKYDLYLLDGMIAL